LEEPVMSIFRIEDSTLKIEAADSSETSAPIYQIRGVISLKAVILIAQHFPGILSKFADSVSVSLGSIWLLQECQLNTFTFC
jgi:hypothetical protein